MNKKKIAFLLVLAISAPLVLNAQTDVALAPELGGRITLRLNKKIVNRWHVYLEEEARFDQNFGAFDRLQTTVGMNYKVHENIKLGLGYSLINGYASTTQAFKNPRHRVFFDVKGTIHYGYWNFSLKERFQVTRRTGDYNVYQNPKNALTLKSRLKVSYKGFGKVEPYAYFEVRNYLNAPVIEAAYDGSGYYTIDDYSDTGEAGWFLKGFKGGYVNRLRGSIGVDVKLDRRNTLNFYFLGDYLMDKVVDANAEGTKLKSYTKETGFLGWFGAGYEFAF